MSFITELANEIKKKKIVLNIPTDTERTLPKTILEDLEKLNVSKGVGNFLYFENGIPFQTFIEFYRFLVDEEVIRFKDNKMILTGMDVGRISLYHIEFPLLSNNFISFRTESIGLNMEDFSRRINLKKKDLTDLAIFTNERMGRLYIIKRQKENSIRTYKTLYYLDLDKEDIPIENLLKIQYSHKIEMDKKNFSKIFSVAKKDLSEIVDITIDENNPSISLKFGDNVIIIDDFYSYEGDDKTTVSFSVTYIYKIKKLLSIIDEEKPIRLELKHDHPLKLIIPIKLSEDLKGDFIYFLAPRWEETDLDDDDMDEF
jgi:hypothetical protein